MRASVKGHNSLQLAVQLKRHTAACSPLKAVTVKRCRCWSGFQTVAGSLSVQEV